MKCNKLSNVGDWTINMMIIITKSRGISACFKHPTPQSPFMHREWKAKHRNFIHPYPTPTPHRHNGVVGTTVTVPTRLSRLITLAIDDASNRDPSRKITPSHSFAENLITQSRLVVLILVKKRSFFWWFWGHFCVAARLATVNRRFGWRNSEEWSLVGSRIRPLPNRSSRFYQNAPFSSQCD